MDELYHKYLMKQKLNKLIILTIQIAILVLFFVIWEIAAYFNWIDAFIFSSPSRIGKLLISYIQNKEIFYHTWISTYEVILGLIIGTILGIIIAIILFEFKILAKILDPFLVVLNALPKTALAPIFIIWIGTNIKGIVFVAISISLILTIINAYNAFNNVSEEKIKLLKTFGANRFVILKELILPANIDEIINIVKVNIGMSWIGVIVGEFIVSKAGLGYLITYGTQVFRLDLVMLGVFVLAIITMLMYLLLNLGVKIYQKLRGW